MYCSTDFCLRNAFWRLIGGALKRCLEGFACTEQLSLTDNKLSFHRKFQLRKKLNVYFIKRYLLFPV